MNILCIENNNIKPPGFQALNKRKVEAKFNGGKITSDAGILLPAPKPQLYNYPFL